MILSIAGGAAVDPRDGAEYRQEDRLYDVSFCAFPTAGFTSHSSTNRPLVASQDINRLSPVAVSHTLRGHPRESVYRGALNKKLIGY